MRAYGSDDRTNQFGRDMILKPTGRPWSDQAFKLRNARSEQSRGNDRLWPFGAALFLVGTSLARRVREGDYEGYVELRRDAFETLQNTIRLMVADMADGLLRR